MERFDRFLANPKWIKLYQDASVRHLVRIYLDHWVIKLDLQKYIPRDNNSFRIEQCGPTSNIYKCCSRIMKRST